MKNNIYIHIFFGCMLISSTTNFCLFKGLWRDRTVKMQEGAQVQSILEMLGTDSTMSAQQKVEGFQDLLDALQADTAQQAHTTLQSLFAYLQDIKILLNEYIHSSGIIRESKEKNKNTPIIQAKNISYDSYGTIDEDLKDLLYSLEAENTVQASENLQKLFASFQEKTNQASIIKQTLGVDSFDQAIEKIKNLQSLHEHISNFPLQ